MTNAQIIYNAAQELAEAGLIKYTGRTFELELEDGCTITVRETEAIHTFQYWKGLGFCVRKGEKAIAKLTIWKAREIKPKDGEEMSENQIKMFMKTAAFFAASQVEKIA